MAKSITVSHNSIYDVPRAGINVSEGTWGGHIIEYNDIFETVKETGDHGSIKLCRIMDMPIWRTVCSSKQAIHRGCIRWSKALPPFGNV